MAALVGYLHDGVAAQAHWARALNVLGQRDVRIVREFRIPRFVQGVD